ncbi:hypothetical protein EDC04DRAFT_2607520 [Pisolithus marmoratus]|nr:hypothetical protein EDC04DRAFT_2607520 [Pisolithus marmoratus]
MSLDVTKDVDYTLWCRIYWQNMRIWILSWMMWMELVIWMYVCNCLFIVLGHACALEDQWLRQCMCNTALHDTDMIISPIVKWCEGRVIGIGPIAGIVLHYTAFPKAFLWKSNQSVSNRCLLHGSTFKLPPTLHYAQNKERLIEKMNLAARTARKDSVYRVVAVKTIRPGTDVQVNGVEEQINMMR